MKNPNEAYIAFPANTVRILQQTGFQFKKQLGQNFLIDLHVVEKIVRGAGVSAEDVCIEIGPGIGSLTQVLAEEAGRVLAVEIDKRLIPILEDNLSLYHNLEIVQADFLDLDLPVFLAERGVDKPVRVIGNLPYYITTPIIQKVFQSGIPLKSLSVMVQEEAARRMQARPGDDNYGVMALLVQYYADIRVDAYVPQNCFMPRPGVGSAVITLTKLPEPRVAVRDPAQMFDIIKAAFGQRRKTLVNSLSGSPEFSISKDEVKWLLGAAGISELERGEKLSLEDFARLSDLWSEKQGEVSAC